MHVTNYGRVERGEANSELHTIVRDSPRALDVRSGANLLAGLYGDEHAARLAPRAYSVADFIAARREHAADALDATPRQRQ